MKKIHLIGLSLLSGLLLSISWPENGFSPLIFVAFVPFLFLQDYIGNQVVTKRSPSVFRISYLGFLVWNILTTYWIWNSTAVGGVAAIVLNSLFMSITFWLYHLCRTKIFNNKNGSFILIFFWLSFEYLHMNWDLNWPWLNLGHVFAFQHTWIQWYEYTGVPGGSIWILLMNLLAFHALKAFLNKELNFKKLYLPVLAFFLLGIFPVVVSKMMYKSQNETGEETEVVVVQPNFDPYSEQYDLASREIIDRNLTMASTVITPKTSYVLSPESAIQEAIWEERLHASPGLKMVSNFVQEHPQVSVLIGASTFNNVPKGKEGDYAARKFLGSDNYYFAYNTAFYIDTTRKLEHYHKSKLTPGVEMMPSWFFLRPLRKYAIDLGGTLGTLKMDDERRVFHQANGPAIAAPLICYESVYGEFVTGFIRNGANIIFVITNDGWWGKTPGHRQHFSFSILRAIETRRSVARSANTGISAFINQRGDVFQRTPYWEQAVIRQSLHINNELTFYVKHGDYLSRICAVLAGISAAAGLAMIFIRRKKA
jgi:apolipoprotein N-acyltransferase